MKEKADSYHLDTVMACLESRLRNKQDLLDNGHLRPGMKETLQNEINSLTLSIPLIKDKSSLIWEQNTLHQDESEELQTELIEGKTYLCEDGQIRRLEAIEDELLIYSVPIGRAQGQGQYVWSKLPGTKRIYIESDFLNGRIIE